MLPSPIHRHLQLHTKSSVADPFDYSLIIVPLPPPLFIYRFTLQQPLSVPSGPLGCLHTSRGSTSVLCGILLSREAANSNRAPSGSRYVAFGGDFSVTFEETPSICPLAARVVGLVELGLVASSKAAIARLLIQRGAGAARGRALGKPPSRVIARNENTGGRGPRLPHLQGPQEGLR